MKRLEETFLLDLLDESKRLVIALNVAKEQRIYQHQESSVQQGARHLALAAGDILFETLAANLLTALMVAMGYRMPTGLYSMDDYAELCDFLGAKEEDGKQRWRND